MIRTMETLMVRIILIVFDVGVINREILGVHYLPDIVQTITHFTFQANHCLALIYAAVITR